MTILEIVSLLGIKLRVKSQGKTDIKAAISILEKYIENGWDSAGMELFG